MCQSFLEHLEYSKTLAKKQKKLRRTGNLKKNRDHPRNSWNAKDFQSLDFQWEPPEMTDTKLEYTHKQMVKRKDLKEFKILAENPSYARNFKLHNYEFIPPLFLQQ